MIPLPSKRSNVPEHNDTNKTIKHVSTEPICHCTRQQPHQNACSYTCNTQVIRTGVSIRSSVPDVITRVASATRSIRRRIHVQVSTTAFSVPCRNTAPNRSNAQSPADGTPCLSMYVAALEVYFVFLKCTSCTGFHWVPVKE